MADNTNPDTVISEEYHDIHNTSINVRQIKDDTSETNRDVQDIKLDVTNMRDTLLDIQQFITENRDRVEKSAAKTPTQKVKTPVFNTAHGASTLTGVSLNEMAMRIKAANPKKSFLHAKKEAKDLLKTLSIVAPTADLSVLRKNVGQNFDNKLSNLKVDTKQGNIAKTLSGFDSSKAERIETTQPIQELQLQIDQLKKAVERQTTATRVDTSKPKTKKKIEDLSDATAALKVLGFQMSEIKERLSTLPTGLSVEEQIKHALKPSADRIAARDVHGAVTAALKENAVPLTLQEDRPQINEVYSKNELNSDKVKKVADKTAPTISNKFNDPLKKKGKMDVLDLVPKGPKSNPINQDEIVDREKKDNDKEEKDKKKKDDDENKKKVNNKLNAIQQSIKDIHSESFVGLLVMAIGALLLPLAKKAWEGIQWIKQKLQPVFDMISNIWDKYFSTDMSSLHQKRSERFVQSEQQAMKAEQEQHPEKAAQIRINEVHAQEQDKDDDDINSRLQKQGDATSAKEAIKLGKKSYTYQENGVSTTHVMNENDYKAAGEDVPADMIKPAKKPTPKVEPLKPTSNLKKQADDLSHVSEQKSSAATPTASTIIVPMHTKETQVPVMIPGSGGDNSSIAILAARNDESSTQNYIGSIFDHPATYGPAGRV